MSERTSCCRVDRRSSRWLTAGTLASLGWLSVPKCPMCLWGWGAVLAAFTVPSRIALTAAALGLSTYGLIWAKRSLTGMSR